MRHTIESSKQLMRCYDCDPEKTTFREFQIEFWHHNYGDTITPCEMPYGIALVNSYTGNSFFLAFPFTPLEFKMTAKVLAAEEKEERAREENTR